MKTDMKSARRKIVHKSLEDRVQDYWNVSRIWNGRGGQMRVGDALKVTSHILLTSNPHSKLALRAASLENEIIRNQQ